jgi:hypothetical protein
MEQPTTTEYTFDPAELVAELHSSLKLGNKRIFWKSHKNCFIGSDAVEWMVQNGKAPTADEAVALGDMLMACKLIINVTNAKEPFSNSNSYYRFSDEDIAHVAPSPEQDTKEDSAFWQHYAKHIFGKPDDAGENLLPELPWEDKQLHEGMEEIATSIPPIDEWNVKLLGNVHPVPWDNPPVKPMYNLVVIGGGAAGLVSAIGSAGVGAKVALIEGHLLGGDCTNFGCVPSKALIKSASVIHSARNGATYGLDITGGDEAIKVRHLMCASYYYFF